MLSSRRTPAFVDHGEQNFVLQVNAPANMQVDLGKHCADFTDRTAFFAITGRNELADVVEVAVDPQRAGARLGFSMGGSMILKYLGKNGKQVDSRIDRAIVFSVPCDLRTSEMTLEHGINLIASRRASGNS